MPQRDIRTTTRQAPSLAEVRRLLARYRRAGSATDRAPARPPRVRRPPSASRRSL
jgi:hypothetical protein